MRTPVPVTLREGDKEMDNPFKVRPHIYALFVVGSASSIIMYLLAEEYHALVWCTLFWAMCYMCAKVAKDALVQRMKAEMLAEDFASISLSLGKTLEAIDEAKRDSYLDK
jgi:ATP/ADP translocase